ncbi:MAG: hypothetical protein FD181_1937 [Prolixibacteraceae bacterium]|nr:MAG: hypothetical protein FD181_1937 [Prolixibacteraceae bacterium]
MIKNLILNGKFACIFVSRWTGESCFEAIFIEQVKEIHHLKIENHGLNFQTVHLLNFVQLVN